VARAELAQRIVVGVAAAAVIAWLAVSIADMHALTGANRASLVVLRPHASAAERKAALRRGLADTRSAEDLRPGDESPAAARAYLYAFAGNTRQALRAAQRLARAEPRNRLAWMAIESLAQSSDPRLSAQATARLRTLVRDPSRRR